ncbi:tetratricopeptide repeat-containing sulfotransferase family protein [Microbulbifer litoralis]|uniref:tetratricopeptide repeat-containing sulfotransferase family protein n=1 Tax=Microbulbifer litoralis TaxID=2933965 RepID=UPI002028391E|nr:tetratricopeptide repeat-containing sulfotransferase family protein [Microbulbifer sp. GX H0434]
MSFSSAFIRRLNEARTLVAQNRFSEAERLYQELLSVKEGSEGLLREQFHLYMQWKRPVEALRCLKSLAQAVPDRPEYWLHLAELAKSFDKLEIAINAYYKFLRVIPDRPNTIFNLAHLLKQAGYLEEALEKYCEALEKNISGQEEVYTNIGVIYSELRSEEKAREYFEKAIEINCEYVPSLVNLAGILEEEGERNAASNYYKKVLEIDDSCYLALCRLAYLKKAKSESDPLVKRISSLVVRKDLSSGDLEELNFALGKLLDDCGSYDKAFSRFRHANEMGARRFISYDKFLHEKLVDELIGTFSQEWFFSALSKLPTAPVFICGMFRSGSTLLEQILSAHPRVVAGGELEFFPDLVDSLRDRYPQGLAKEGQKYFERIGRKYLAYLEKRFSSKSLVTDKRPDNFLHVGLIKSVLPKSRIIWTRRSLLNNCLSVYFQQMGGGMNYSVDLDSIGHYYVEQVRLMEHWKTLFPDSIFEIEYEKLVADPEPEIRRLLNFLRLPWDPACLNFSTQKTYVKTASIWQVRESIHQRSTDRHKNYGAYLKVLEKYLLR